MSYEHVLIHMDTKRKNLLERKANLAHAYLSSEKSELAPLKEIQEEINVYNTLIHLARH